jgi:hypothetical protein
MQHRLELTTIGSNYRSEASALVDQALAAGELSNRTQPARYKEMLAAVLTVASTRKSVEVTNLDWGDGKTSGYNLVHRLVSAKLMRPMTTTVQVIALETQSIKPDGSAITGKSNTTAPLRQVRLFVTPRAVEKKLLSKGSPRP